LQVAVATPATPEARRVARDAVISALQFAEGDFDGLFGTDDGDQECADELQTV
jgi:hypothetical protein